jgi:Arc/MetJ family transcription regulator
MKTTLDIPEGLFEEAIRHSKARTKRAAVILAMEEFVRRAEMKSLADSLGDSETFMSPQELMELRWKGISHDSR